MHSQDSHTQAPAPDPSAGKCPAQVSLLQRKQVSEMSGVSRVGATVKGAGSPWGMTNLLRLFPGTNARPCEHGTLSR